jgi:hypothetical protein
MARKTKPPTDHYMGMKVFKIHRATLALAVGSIIKPAVAAHLS